MRCRTLLTLGFLLLSGGCAAAAGAGAGGEARASNRNVITLAEIVSQERHQTAYDVVQGLRPGWLRTRSQGTMNAPEAGALVIYVNDMRMGGVETLRSISRDAIEALEYLSPTDATTRFGTGHMGGAILVRGRRGS